MPRIHHADQPVASALGDRKIGLTGTLGNVLDRRVPRSLFFDLLGGAVHNLVAAL